MKEILARQLILKNIYAMAYKKTRTRNLITKKNSCGSKIALPPPITFLMVCPLCAAALKHGIGKRKQKGNTE